MRAVPIQFSAAFAMTHDSVPMFRGASQRPQQLT
jgi:hypothetical protein